MTAVMTALTLGVLIAVGVVIVQTAPGPTAPSDPPSAPARTPGTPGEASVRVAEDTPLTEVMAADELDGVGELLFPFPDRITEDMTIADTARLLPYHSNIDPAEVARTVDDVLDRARVGELTFYPIYTDAQIAKDPSKADIGLFLFPGQPGGPFSIVSPGGGFSYVGSIHEGFPHAQEIASHGHHAFVLNYRTGDGGRSATEDLAAAIDYVFANADALGVDTDGYALWGSSAGARMAANLGSYGTAALGWPDRPRPAAVIMAYTGHTEVAGQDPATFAVVGQNDGIAPPGVMRDRIDRLDRAGVPTELHVYPDVRHGFGLGTGTPAEGWVEDALAFWEAHRR